MTFIKQNLLLLSGIVAGSVAGYLYYHYVGCNGSCMIASSPVISTFYGALMGGLSVNLFRSKTIKEGAD